MKSTTTVRRWIKELESAKVSPLMEVYRQGMVCALRCVLGPDWPAPIEFATFAKQRRERLERGGK